MPIDNEAFWDEPLKAAEERERHVIRIPRGALRRMDDPPEDPHTPIAAWDRDGDWSEVFWDGSDWFSPHYEEPMEEFIGWCEIQLEE